MAQLSALLTLPGLSHDLKRVETALQDAVRCDDPFLTEVASHLMRAGGKRLRPALALAASYAAHPAPAPQEAVMAGVAVELVHLGSLYHDDVMDEADTRRGVESVNARWGNLVAIVAGDFLLARASEIAASLGTEVAGLLAATIGALCEGQVRELSHAFDVGRTEDDYLAVIANKTGALLAASCRIGAIVAGLPRDQIDALTEYGQQLGMVFQIVDDILDVVSTDEELGKPAGNDLVEGVYTLPVIRALADGDGGPLRDMLGRPLTRPDADRARTLVRSDGAVASAVSVAGGYAADAGEALAPLDHSGPAAALRSLAGELVDSVRS